MVGFCLFCCEECFSSYSFRYWRYLKFPIAWISFSHAWWTVKHLEMNSGCTYAVKTKTVLEFCHKYKIVQHIYNTLSYILFCEGCSVCLMLQFKTHVLHISSKQLFDNDFYMHLQCTQFSCQKSLIVLILRFNSVETITFLFIVL